MNLPSTSSDNSTLVQVKTEPIRKEKVVAKVSTEVKNCLKYYYQRRIINAQQYIDIQDKASEELIRRWIVNKNVIIDTVKNMVINTIAEERDQLKRDRE